MSITILASHTPGGDTSLDRAALAAGIADAYDEHTAGTPLSVLRHRLQMLTEHLDDAPDPYVAYVLGYADAVLTIARLAQATITAQIQIAFEDQETTR